MIPVQSATGVDVACHVRATSLVAPVDETVERLREFTDEGVVDDLTVETWPDEVVIDEETEDDPAVERYRRFGEWAEDADVSLRPAFTVRERTTLVEDRPKTALVLPVCCLAVYRDGELACVAPHRDGDETYTVDDALADLERGTRLGSAPTREGPPVPTTPLDAPERCPACDRTVVNGQGVYACPACSWRGESVEEALAVTPEAGAGRPTEAKLASGADGATAERRERSRGPRLSPE